MDQAKGAKKRAQTEKQRALAIAARLAHAYPEMRVPLRHRNPFELLIATILSAQCTDEQVNRVTPALFSRYPDAQKMADAPLAKIEEEIRSLGLFRLKARAVKRCAAQLIEEFDGRVPAAMEELTRLRGVGRKTANVILGHAFGVPGIVVDTHVKRLSRRLGLAREENPDRIESELAKLLPASDWTDFSLRLILHGRKVCRARKPRCHDCVLNDLCPSRKPSAA
jgi:endonuclease-3